MLILTFPAGVDTPLFHPHRDPVLVTLPPALLDIITSSVVVAQKFGVTWTLSSDQTESKQVAS